MCTTITQNLLHARRGGWSQHFLGRAGSSFSNPHFLFADKTWNGHFDQQKRREERHWESSAMFLVMAWFFKSKIRFLSSKRFGYKIWMYKILWRLEYDILTTKSRTRLILFSKELTHFRSKDLADFSTYDTQISGATVKHVLQNKYNWSVPPQYVNFKTKNIIDNDDLYIL